MSIYDIDCFVIQIVFVCHQVTWSDGTINSPPDTPICGFMGELCVKPVEGKTTFRSISIISL